MKRRIFLKSASATLAMGGLGLHAVLATAADGADAFAWSRARADTLVGQSFWLNHPESGAMAVTLAAVLAPARLDPHLDQFSLVFRAAGKPLVADGIYDMDHPAIGRFALHLTPAGVDANGASFRSDFTLLT
ncbi:DUF6916 family protein [Massilia sp.]|uniref:DUF6916 family protein n=1 Tax=Massilia sp. TaxID=1882437 RepID=UPI0028AF2DAB|nr:hypothetical protein [Massilia sp.]